MNRRRVLRGLFLAGVLVGCGSRSQGTTVGGQPPAPFDPVTQVAPGADENLSVVSGSFEQLVGRRPFAFGLTDRDNRPVTGAQVDVWVVPAAGGSTAGPFPARFHEVADQPLGLYVAEVDIPQPGATAFVAVTGDGRAGSDAIEVATAATSRLAAPGDAATAVPTPTTADPKGYQRICTADPPCGMHEVSLDQALAAKVPMALEFATPAYCQTAVCGPSVTVLDQVRASRDWGDTAFVHVEIYSDAGQTLSEPVQRWALPSEPWLFVIGRDGTIVDRADGPLLTLADQVSGLVSRAS